MMSLKNILLSNDDGYLAPGICALYKTLIAIPGVAVWVIAPEQNCSGASNSLTLWRPLSVETAANGFRYVNGTPTDCVHIALTDLLKFKPDLVVSGINNGPNMGEDVLYSGTVAAAMEGFLFKVPAIAFSLASKNWLGLDQAAQIAQLIVIRYLNREPNSPMLLNINIPDLSSLEQINTLEQIDIKVTSLGKRHPSQPAIRATDPRNRVIYWIGGSGEAILNGKETDFAAIDVQQVSVTPLQLDLSDHKRFNEVNDLLENISDASSSLNYLNSSDISPKS